MSFITALVIQQDHSVFVDTQAGTVGQKMLIPTPNSGGQVDSDYWATPIVNYGIQGTGFRYTPTTPTSTTKPTAQSFHVIRVITSKQSTDWYAVGTSNDYTAASEEAECCGTTSPAPVMPTTLPIFAPCTVLCNQDVNGNYFAVFAVPIPKLTSYVANGYYNEVALPQITAASLAALIIALNGNGSWSAIGTWSSPVTSPADVQTLIVTQTGGTGTSSLCVAFTTV